MVSGLAPTHALGEHPVLVVVYRLCIAASRVCRTPSSSTRILWARGQHTFKWHNQLALFQQAQMYPFCEIRWCWSGGVRVIITTITGERDQNGCHKWPIQIGVCKHCPQTM